MATLVGTQKSLSQLLTTLIELDYDAIEAYRLAIRRLDRVEVREHFTDFLSDHERHVEELTALMRQAGWEAPHGGDLKQLVTKGKVLIGDIVGGDRAILAAMGTNEDDTNRAYERIVHRLGTPAEVLALAERNLADERRHRAWIERRLALLEEEEEAFARDGDDEVAGRLSDHERDARL